MKAIWLQSLQHKVFHASSLKLTAFMIGCKMSESKLYFVENNMVGAQHIRINAALINVFKRVFRHHDTVLASCESVYNNLEKSGCSIKKILDLYVVKQGDNVKKFVSDIFSWFVIIPSIFKLNGKSVVVFLSLFPTSHLILRLFSWFVRCDIFVVLHRDLDFLNHLSFSPVKPSFWMRFAFFIPIPKNKITYIVLGEHIVIPHLLEKQSIVKLNHPVIYDVRPVCRDQLYNGTFNIGLIGTASKFKNTHLFFEVARMLDGHKKLKFTVAGSCDSSVYDYRFDSVDADFSGVFLDEEVVSKKLRSFDFALFFYGEDLNSFASGALIDAVRYEIPILALRNSYFEWLKSKGIEFFITFDTVDDMVFFLQNEEKLNELIGFFDFKKARAFFSVDAAVKILNNNI